MCRFLIIEPHGTSYGMKPFVFAIPSQLSCQLAKDLLPLVDYGSWKDNPNLYEYGLVCLPLFGTSKSEKDNEA
jgi:hypothetical protein